MKLFKHIDFDIFYNLERAVYKKSNSKYEAYIRFYNISKWFRFRYKAQLIYLIPINLIIVIYKYLIFIQTKHLGLPLQHNLEIQYNYANIKTIQARGEVVDPTFYNKYITETESQEHINFIVEQGKKQVLEKLLEELKKYVDIKIEDRKWEGRYIITTKIKIVKTNEGI